jgi:hypothetical protein
MTGPIRDTLGERHYDSYVESPTRANKTAVEVFIGSTNGLLTTEKVAVTIDSLHLNAWVNVEFVSIKNVATVETFDSIDNEKIILEWRITAGNSVQIRSKNELTTTVHIIGYI